MKTKNLFTYLMFLAVVSLASCSDRPGDTKAPQNPDDTALDLYYKYASNKNLTVAYLGDFALGGDEIDALMIQSDNDEDWIMLQQEFGMMPAIDDDSSIVSVGIGIEADFLDEAMFDTLTDISQISEEDLNRFTLIVAEKIRNIMNASDYLEEDLEQQKSQNERIMTNAMNHGHSGYVTAANHDKRAVWLFFYDNQEECNNILTHIKEDLR